MRVLITTVVIVCCAASADFTSMNCTEIRTFLGDHTENVVTRIRASNETGTAAAWSLSHAHVMAAILHQRNECITETLRLNLLMFLGHLKSVMGERYKLVLRNPTNDTMTDESYLVHRFGNIMDSLRMGLKSLPDDPTTEYYTHENDGRLSTLEAMRIHTFNNRVMEKDLCLLQFAISDLFQIGDRVIDVGSGPLAEHSEWFNKTGLVAAVPVDGASGISLITGGKVLEIDARKAEDLARIADGANWIWCINVLDQVTADSATAIAAALQGSSGGLVLTWNNQNATDVFDIRTLDKDKTERMRSHCNGRTDIYVFTPNN